MTTAALMIAGLFLLVAGGEVLVRGASSLARSVGLSPLVVGLTVVAFATSAPELAVTLQAVTAGTPEIAIGNVVGSNIANILLVLGASAIVLPLAVRSQLVRLDIPIMIVFSLAFFVVARDLSISSGEAAVLLGGLAVYLVVSLVVGRAEQRRGEQVVPVEGPPLLGEPPAPDERPLNPFVALLLIALGVLMLVAGAQFLVSGAREVATALGVSELVIGLTIVAVGTSLPELATSIIAAMRNERDLAVGNIVGSNIFNIGAVLGISGVISDGIPVDEAAVAFDIPVMILVALLLLPLAFTRLTIHRWEGVVLVAVYVLYTAYLLLAAAEHSALEPFSFVLTRVAIPLTVLVVAVGVISDLRDRRAESAVSLGSGSG